MSTVDVKGLVEFNRAVNRMAETLPKIAQDIALNAVVIIVTDAVPTIPRVSGRAAKSVQGYVTNQGARVEGGKGVEYFAWLAIGGASGRKHANFRRIVKPDRYLNPAYERNKSLIQRESEEMFNKACRAAGLEVTG